MNYFKCCDYPCAKVKKVQKSTKKIDYLFRECGALYRPYLESMSEKELQCDLCRIETVINEIATGKTDYPNIEVARLCSEHTLAVMAYMNFGVWHTLHLSHYESAKFWIRYLFSNE